MKAIVIDQFGDPDLFHQKDVDRPTPGATELLVRVVATSVNPIDYKLRRGSDRYDLDLPATLGYDVSGIVEEAGEYVDDFTEGDEIFYTPATTSQGSYAEYHVAPSSIVAHKPEHLSHEEAAALPLAGCTAWQALFDRALLQAGQTVLIHGTGGVGALAVQMARAAGADVTAVSSPTMLERIQELGADRIINYREEDFSPIMQDAGVTADIVFDTVGGDTLARSVAVAAPLAQLVTIVASAELQAGPAMSKNLSTHFLLMQRDGDTMRSVARMARRGDLRPVIADVLPLGEVAEAHRRLEAGGVPGKLVLRV